MSENNENIDNTDTEIQANNGNDSQTLKKRPTLEMLES